MKPTLTPYLNFNRDTKQAMEFYQSVLGGELKMQTYKEAGFPHDPKDDNLVIHAELRNDSLSFMCSDGGPDHPVTMGNNIYMSIVGSDEKLLRSYFEGLSKGGIVDMPLAKQFWGDIYGQLTDKFGIHWTINIAAKSE